MNTNNRIVICIFIALFLAINIWTLKEGHDWGGDFSQYIRHAKNIIENKNYSDSIDLDLRIISPPGFPLLLAPFVKVFGLNFRFLKLLNVLLWAGIAIFTYLLAKKRIGDKYALLILTALLSSPFFFTFKQSIISDIPFTFFVTSSIYFFSQYYKLNNNESTKRLRHLSFSILLMTYACLTRFVGILLFFTAIICVIASDKNKKDLFLILLGLLFTLWFQTLLKINPIYHLKENTLPINHFVMLFRTNIHGSFLRIFDFYFPYIIFPLRFITVLLRQIIYFLSTFLFVLMLSTFIYKIYKNRLSFLGCFFVLYLFSVSFWIISSGNNRYILPIANISLILFIECFQYVINKISFLKNPTKISYITISLIFIIIIFNNSFTITKIFHFDTDQINKKDVIEMTRWVRDNTDKNDRFMFSKPRVLGLLTNRMGASFFLFDEDNSLCPRIIQHEIDYLIIPKSINSYMLNKFQECQLPSREMWENHKYIILMIDKPIKD